VITNDAYTEKALSGTLSRQCPNIYVRENYLRVEGTSNCEVGLSGGSILGVIRKVHLGKQSL
jgi:hypothetical protein